MANKVTGGCLCGAVRFEHDSDVGAAAYCHCEDCRRCTGSAFNISVGVEAARFRIVAGAPKGFTRTADSGHELTRYFCPECGSPVYTDSPRHPDRVYVKAGSFDDPAAIRPAYQCWTRSAVSWAKIPPELGTYPKGRGGRL